MGKKKTPEDLAREREEKQKRDQVRLDHQKLQRRVDELQDHRTYVETAISSPAMAPVINKFERDVDEIKESLVAADKKDVERLQANVVARRQLISTLRSAYESELTEAKNELRRFEQQNALFLQAEDESEKQDDSSDEALSA